METSNDSLQTDTRSILRVAIPISLGIFVQFIVAFIDNIFVAQVDSNAMSAASFVGLIYVTLVMLGVGLGNATQILVARRKGESQLNIAGQITGNAFAISFLLAAIQFVLLYYIAPGIIDRTIESVPVKNYMRVFIQYRAYGFFFYTPLLVLNSFWSGIAHTRPLVYTTAIMASVTILLDYLFVFGNLGFPEMGMTGAALATSIAEASALLFAFVYTWRVSSRYDTATSHNDTNKSYQLNKWLLSFNTRFTKSITALGTPIALQLLTSLGIWVVFYVFVESMGERELQSSFIVRNMYTLAYVSVGGFSTTAKTYISGLIAEKRQSELHGIMFKMMMLNLGGILFLSHGLWLYPESIAGMFTTDPIVIDQTVDSMHIVLPAMMIFAFTSILLATVEGSGNAVAGFVIEMITVAVYILTAWYMVYDWRWPIHLVWTSDYVYFLLIGILSGLYLWNGKWKWNKL
jgi:MATE family multidrug resistance protein